MPAPTATFPCPFCSRRMGVTAEYLGRQVRCPHCKQVVLAPASAGASPAPAAPPPAQQPQPPKPVVQIVSPPPPPAPAPVPPPPPPTEPELPVFNIPSQKEGADSILSEEDESEDEVFGSTSSARRRSLAQLGNPDPSLPATDPVSHLPAVAPLSEQPTAYATTPTPPTPLPPPPPTPASQAPTVEIRKPVAGVEPPTSPPSFTPPAPTPAQTTASGAVSPTSEQTPSNPFAGFDAPSPEPAAELPPEPEERPLKKKRDRHEPAEPEDRPARAGRPRPEPAGKRGGMSLALILLAGYALLATGVAVYALFFKPQEFDTGHPLSTIPDNFGEFDPATRKKVVQYKFPVDGELPAAQRGGLGETIAVGGLEIQPVRVEKRRLQFITEAANGEKLEEWSQVPAFVLTLAIKNTTDLNIFPMDPAFTRRAAGEDRPITRLVVNRQTVFAGGAIGWPLSERVRKRMEVQQQNDYVPLRPGESREYVVFTNARPEIVEAVEGAKGPLQWRVQVRRGPVVVRGKEVPVTAIIGVDFNASDVKQPG